MKLRSTGEGGGYGGVGWSCNHHYDSQYPRQGGGRGGGGEKNHHVTLVSVAAATAKTLLKKKNNKKSNLVHSVNIDHGLFNSEINNKKTKKNNNK